MTTRIPAYMAGIPGAAGNGTTDDGAALAAAKAAHPTKLQLGGGLTYKITANLTAGWRMLDGKILDSRTVTAQDDYSVVGLGEGALAANTFIPEVWAASGGRFFASGNHLVGVGWGALAANTTGRRNTAVGSRTLLGNTTGYYNTALGSHTLESCTVGYENTAVGVQSLQAVANGFVQQVDAGKAREGRAGDDRRRRTAGVGIFARFLLGERNQFGD